MSNTTPPPPPMPDWSPAPQPPKKPNTPAIIIGSTAAVIVAIVATGAVVVNSRDSAHKTSPATATTSAPADTVTPTEEPTPTPSDTGPTVLDLTDTASYQSGLEVTLSGLTRKVSSDVASPSNTPYLQFTVKVTNGSNATVDMSTFTVSCAYGKDGHEADSIFDEGLNGGPNTQLLAGRSINVPWGCALPTGESTVQIDVTPKIGSQAAIFTGAVK